MEADARVAEWRDAGKIIDTPDGLVWTRSFGDGPGTPVLVLHGFPTSSYDFRQAITALRGRRVIVLDFLGFGLSSKPARFGYSIFEHTDTALVVMRHHELRRVHVWAHDMGTSVATELLARQDRGLLTSLDLASVTLMNGSVVVELAHLRAGQKLLMSPLGAAFARATSRRLFQVELARVCANKPARAELEAAWELMAREDGTRRLPQTIGYVEERKRFRARWHNAVARSRVPLHVAWALKDPVAVPAIADALCGLAPRARRTNWPELGHYPQLEDPARVARAVSEFWDAVDGAAKGAAKEGDGKEGDGSRARAP